MHSGLYAQETQLFTKNGIRPMIGFSLPELLHIGARYQMDDLQYGLSILVHFPLIKEASSPIPLMSFGICSVRKMH
jgi:hypothetical protein